MSAFLLVLQFAGAEFFFRRAVTWIQQIPWANRLIRKWPFGNEDVHKFQKFTISIASNRLKMGSNTKDLFYYLVRKKKKPDDCYYSAKYNLTSPN